MVEKTLNKPVVLDRSKREDLERSIRQHTSNEERRIKEFLTSGYPDVAALGQVERDQASYIVKMGNCQLLVIETMQALNVTPTVDDIIEIAAKVNNVYEAVPDAVVAFLNTRPRLT